MILLKTKTYLTKTSHAKRINTSLNIRSIEEKAKLFNKWDVIYQHNLTAS